MCPLAVLLSHLQRRFFTDNTYHILGITGMRGVKAGVSPPRRSPPCKYVYTYVGHVVSAMNREVRFRPGFEP